MILPLVLVTLDGANPDIERDLDVASTVWEGECEVFVDVIDRLVVDRDNLLLLDQDDCLGVGHSVSDEEDELFDLGRGLGTDVVGYYIIGDTGGALRGCAAHPPGRRGFWVGDSATDFTFAHEMTHVVGNNIHVGDSDNLMFAPTTGITNPPPDLSEEQCVRILEDPALLSIPSIVLNL